MSWANDCFLENTQGTQEPELSSTFRLILTQIGTIGSCADLKHQNKFQMTKFAEREAYPAPCCTGSYTKHLFVVFCQFSPVAWSEGCELLESMINALLVTYRVAYSYVYKYSLCYSVLVGMPII